MLYDRYFDALLTKIQEIREHERDSILKAARLCTDTLQSKGVIHIYDTGHLVNQELTNRAGGMAAFNPLKFNFNVDTTYNHRERDREPVKTEVPYETQLVSMVITRGGLRPGDVLIIGTVSGKSSLPIELARQAREHGLKVICVTAVSYSSKLKSSHSSGKLLYEVGDVVIDNHADYGDAMLEVEGLDRKIIPASGMGAVVALWALVAGIAEEMLSRGLEPTFFMSANRPDGPEQYQASLAAYREKGF